MYPQNQNGHRGFAKRQLEREKARRQTATEWQPEVFITPKEGKKMSTVLRNVLIAVATIILIGLCLWGTVFVYRQVRSDFAPQAIALVPTQAPAYVTPAVQQQPPTTSNCGQPNLQVLYITVVNPKDSPQPQIGHPSAYSETHVSGTPVCVVIDVPIGYKAIVGGVTVDKLTDGVYRGFGTGHFEVIVTNGFALITTDTWAKAEWDFRIAQTIQYKWANAHLDPGPIK